LEVLETIEKNGGMTKLYADTQKRAEAINAALQAIGLHIYPQRPARSMTTVDDADASKIRKVLAQKFSVNVAGGQDHLTGKIFRINQMGLIPDYEAAWVVNAVELTLDMLGRRKYDGSANKIFNEILFANRAL
ncbi:MAG: alanine--glyoxylate aminotransferase family protein, partial [Sulfurimonas sp.]|nr:alanine--glyoxylate aminotransferase family protein [Sulfurimonas sp.]